MPPLWQPQHALLLTTRLGLRPLVGAAGPAATLSSGAFYRDGALGGDGQSATTSSVALVIPATAQVGDVAVAAFTVTATASDGGDFTTPAGWTRLSGPDPSGAGALTYGFLFSYTVQAGDAGSTVTFTYNLTKRITGVLALGAGVTATGAAFSSFLDSTSGTTTELPTLAGVPAGALVLAFWGRRSAATTAISVTIPAPWTAGAQAASAYATAGNNAEAVGYQVATGDTYGGEFASTGADSTTGVNYVVALPASGPAAPAATGGIVLGGSPVAAADVSAAGSITLGGSPAGQAPDTAAGSITLGGSPAGAAAPATAAGSITLGGSATAGTPPPGATGVISLGGAPVAKAPATSGGGGIVLAGSPTARAPATAGGGSITLGGSAAAQVSARYQVWTGTAWKPITPLVWNGTVWAAIPVTLVP